MLLWKAILILVLYCIILDGQLQNNCRVTFATSGNSYDITPAYDINEDYVSPADSGGNIYYVAPCHNTKLTCSPSASPVCQVDGAKKPHSCGTLASASLPTNIGQWTETTPIGSGFIVHYTQGDGGRNVELTYVCGSANKPSFVGNPTENPVKDYHITLNTLAGCKTTSAPTPPGPPGPPTPSPPKPPGSSSFDPGWIFVIVVLAGLVLYFIIGVIVKKFVFNAETVPEMIPQYEFWTALPILVKDGAVYSFGKVKSLITGERDGYSYTRV